ncbi:MAG: MaoC family dehydratase [Actinomycetota bacterium]|nr:MaoC family dehydratase [Actinomycetota bacterium]
MTLSELTGNDNWFEDFPVGRRMRHARSATVDEVENSFLTKTVMNTAQSHWNAEVMAGSPLGEGKLVFGLITGSMTVGLTSQDTAENALAELGLDAVRFAKPVHHGDTITAYSEVLEATDSTEHPDAGVVRFAHWGCN